MLAVKFSAREKSTAVGTDASPRPQHGTKMPRNHFSQIMSRSAHTASLQRVRSLGVRGRRVTPLDLRTGPAQEPRADTFGDDPKLHHVNGDTGRKDLYSAVVPGRTFVAHGGVNRRLVNG
jgi:hypothetical protein